MVYPCIKYRPYGYFSFLLEVTQGCVLRGRRGGEEDRELDNSRTSMPGRDARARIFFTHPAQILRE